MQFYGFSTVYFAFSLTILLTDIIEICYLIPALCFYLGVLIQMVFLKIAHVIRILVCRAWEEGTLNEELPPSDWLMGMIDSRFLDC